MSKPYLNKPCKPSLRVKPIQPYINNISISHHSENKWQEEFQKEKVTSPFIVDKDTSPFLVGRTNSPIILGPHTTLERFEHEILKKDNVFKIPLSGVYDFSILVFSSSGSGAVIQVMKNGVKQLVFRSGNSQYESMSANWMLALEENDLVQIKVIQGSLIFDSKAKGTINGKILFTENTDAVAFTAYSTSGGTMSSNSDITFDHLLLNVGNAFNAGTGVFTAPKTGNYEFSWTLNSPSNQYLYCILLRNGNVELLKFFASEIAYSSNGMKFVTPLYEGETIRLKTDSYPIYTDSNQYRVFSGKFLPL